MNIEIPPFYVGQEVVAIASHEQGVFKVGDEFTVLAIMMTCCGWGIDVGRPKIFPSLPQPCEHGNLSIMHHNDLYSIQFFAPKHKFRDFISMKQLVEETLEVTGAN